MTGTSEEFLHLTPEDAARLEDAMNSSHDGDGWRA